MARNWSTPPRSIPAPRSAPPRFLQKNSLAGWVVLVLSMSLAPPSWSMAEELPQGVIAEIDGRVIEDGEFHRYLAEEFLGESLGDEALDFLVDEALVLREARKRDLGTTPAEVRERILDFDRRMKEQGASLARYLAEAGLAQDEFEATVRQHLLHEKMARQDFDIGKDREVSPAKLRLWLSSQRDRATIKKEGLPQGVVLNVEGRAITGEAFGSIIAKRLTDRMLRERLNELIGILLIEKFLKDQKIELTQEDFAQEIANREDLLRKRHQVDQLNMEDVISIRGMNVEQLQRTRRFRAETGLGKIVDLENGPDGLKKFYEENRDAFDKKFGKRFEVSTIFLKAVTRPNQFASRTYEDAEKLFKQKVKPGLKDGRSFEDLVYFYSEHPSSKKGGSLGLLLESNPEHKPIIAAIFQSKEGDVVGPVKTLSGVHLIRVDRILHAPEFPALRLEVRQALRQKKYSQILGSLEEEKVRRRY